MSVEAVRRSEVGGEVWDATVRAACQRHFMFEGAYLDYHADRFTDASLLVMQKGRPVAALPASRHGDRVISHGGLTFGGLLTTEGLGAGRVAESIDAALEIWRETGVATVSVKPVPHIYHLAPAEEELFAWYQHGATLESRHLAQTVRAGAGVAWSDERVRAVRRGRKAELTLGRTDAVEEFMAMQRERLRLRYGIEPVHTAAEMRLLAGRFPDAIKVFAARHESEMVAGVLIFETPLVAHTQYISQTERGAELRAQDALFAYLLEEVYPDKPWFDFGTSNERDGSLNPGLVRNKEGYGARSVVYDRYVLSI